MRVPLSWLAEFVPWKGSVAALTDRLTMAGLEVARVEEVGRLDPGVRVARILAVEPRPGAERLQLVRLDAGAGARVSVVSAAPGLMPGRVVPLALPGTRLPSGTTVAAAALRGVHSEGMLCSAAELDLGEDAAGLLDLPATAAPGTAVAALPGVADTVLELEITPNRGDCLSVLGVAREVAALTGVRLRRTRPRPRETSPRAADAIAVRLEAPDLCPRYCARLVRGVRVGPSPFDLALRLRRAGMRPINNVVDASNYVMLERGQPLHAFDLARLLGRRIVVRRAAPGERIVTLDGAERVLDGEDLVIADVLVAVAIAGVMGGRDSEVRAETTDLLLESAFFAPLAVRRTARRLGLVSQAAYRFERRVDPAMVPEALDAFAALVARLAGGRVARGVVEDRAARREPAARAIRLRPHRAAAILGMDVSAADVARRLRALGARVRPERAAFLVTPPSHRGDLRAEEDLIEEVARFGGYDAIPVTVPMVRLAPGVESPGRAFARQVRRLLVAEGLTEVVTLAFTDAAMNRHLAGFVGRALAPLAVLNPLSSELGELRRSPLAGLVRALAVNQAQQAPFVGLFELGKGYGLDAAGACQERRAIAILLAGAWPPWGIERAGPTLEFLDLKGMCANLLEGLGLPEPRARWRPADDTAFLHPGKGARLEIDGAAVGMAGALHPTIAQACDLAGEVLVAELDFTDLATYVPRRATLRPLPRFPAVTRDIAVVVDEGFRAGDIVEEIRALGESEIESIRLFDCYRGAPVPPGRKSLAYTIAYRAPDRTLTDDEVNALHGGVRAHLEARFRLEFRA